MKSHYILVIFFFINSLFLQAEETAVSKLLHQIQIAKVEDRRLLINQLKIALRSINKESRQQTMQKLKTNLHNKSSLKPSPQKEQLKEPLKIRVNQKKCEHKNMQQQQNAHQPRFRQLRQHRNGNRPRNPNRPQGNAR